MITRDTIEKMKMMIQPGDKVIFRSTISSERKNHRVQVEGEVKAKYPTVFSVKSDDIPGLTTFTYVDLIREGSDVKLAV